MGLVDAVHLFVVNLSKIYFIINYKSVLSGNNLFPGSFVMISSIFEVKKEVPG